MQLILASNSPRRREILAQIVKEFQTVPSLFEERTRGLSACDTALFFAREKTREVFSRFPHAAVLGADTVVSLGGEIFGKPKNAPHAAEMLKKLSGKTHSVFTAVCLVTDEGEEEFFTESKVTFHSLTEEQIEAYVASGLPLDKAGAYGIQDGYALVGRCEGSYTGVVGLPAEETAALLKRRRLI